MKIIDVPQTGKLGLAVSFRGRNGLIRRQFVVPRNPNSLPQVLIRSNFTNIASRYDSLTESQQDAWSVAAAARQTRATLGQSGPMTGLQLFVKINATLAALGAEQADAPPAHPAFPDNPVDGLVITNLAGVIAIKMGCPSTPPNNTVVRAAPPQRSGVRTTSNFRILGVLPAPVAGACDVTALFVARYGVPAVGSRLFVSTTVTVDGWQAGPRVVSALVPAAA